MTQIDLLPDDVLLEIFDFNVNMTYDKSLKRVKTDIEAWQPLVHVCRRWRSLVFGSPRRLDLKLCCIPGTPAKDTLDVWPALPLILEGDMALSFSNVIAALEQSDRVCEVDLHLTMTGWPGELERVLALMEVPFPKLTDLRLWSYDETPAIPDSFLGGSAPRLKSFVLVSISFPGLPKLLLSATHLAQLYLFGIPHSGYISPQVIVALLSVLSSLRVLCLEFQSPQSRPDWESPSLLPPRRSILPTLIELRFKGVAEYLEELMTRIDTPQLGRMHITFFNQIDFDCPRLAQFIDCTPTLKAPDEAHVEFDDTTVTLRSRTSNLPFEGLLIDVSCRESDWQLSSIEQVCNSIRHPLSTTEDLYIEHRDRELVWNGDGDHAVENTLWLDLLRPFTAAKNLYLSKKFVPPMAAALQELDGDRITEVLPSLQNIFLEELKPSGPFQKNIGQFVASRQLSDHPITISRWELSS